MRRLLARFAVPITLAAIPGQAQADAHAGDMYRGAGIALMWCSVCHVIDHRVTEPAFAGPPPFPEIAEKPEATPAWLRQRLNASHTRMPKMQLIARDKDDVIAYIRSLPFRKDTVPR